MGIIKDTVQRVKDAPREVGKMPNRGGGRKRKKYRTQRPKRNQGRGDRPGGGGRLK